MSSSEAKLRKKLKVKETIEPFYMGGTVTYDKNGEHIFCLFRNRIKMLKTSTGKLVDTFGSDEDEDITCFALSPDDQQLVSASKGLLMVSWDLHSRTPVRTWKSAHQLPVEIMKFDSTSTLLASGGADGTVKIYDMLHSYCTHNLRIHKGVVKKVEFHPDTSRLQLFTSSDDHKIRVWNLQTSETLAVLDKHFSLVTSIAFAADGDTLYSSSRDRIVVAWCLKTYAPLSVIPLSEEVRSLMTFPASFLRPLLPDEASPERDELLLGVGSSGKIRILDPILSKIIFTQAHGVIDGTGSENAEDDASVSFAIHLPSLNCISVITTHHHVFHISLENLSLAKIFMGNNDEVLGLRLISDESFLVVVTNSPDVKLYELSTMNCQLLRGHTSTVLGMDHCETRRLLATVGKDRSCRVWSYKNPNEIICVAIATGHSKSVITCAISGLEGSFLVTGGEDLTLKCWKLSGKLKPTDELKKLKSIFTAVAHSKDINTVAISPNDKFIATGSQDKTAKLWLKEDGGLLGKFNGHRRGIWSLKFSTVDQILATSSADGTIKLWALSDFSCIKSIDAHDASVLAVAFVTRGMQIVSAGSDGLVKLWTVKNAECAGSFDLHDAKVWALETADDGGRVITGAADGKVLFLEDVTEEEELEESRQKEEKILQDQSLSNCLQLKDFFRAFLLALDLNRPRDLLRICNLLLALPDWRERIEKLIVRLRPDQLDALLVHVKNWNTNARTYGVSQTLLEIILRARDPADLKETPGIVGVLESLLPYTQRHYDRMQILAQQATFLDYLWNSMKLEASDKEGEADMDVDNDSGVMEDSDMESS